MDDRAKERSKCTGIAKDPWAGKLSDRLDDVAQTEAGYGEAWAR